MKSSAVSSVLSLAASGWLLAAPSASRASAVPAPDAGATRRVEVTASRYVFEPALIEARLGDVVEIVARSTDTDHGLAIKPLGVKLAIPRGGSAVSATFVASRPGRFPIECSEYCGSGHKRMKGELVVAEVAR